MYPIYASRLFVRRCFFPLIAVACLATGTPVLAALAKVEGVDFQPLVAHVQRLRDALQSIGEPLSAEENRKIDEAIKSADGPSACAQIQQVLDPHCLIGVTINPESRVKAASGPAKPLLVQSGWRTFLVKVNNQAGVTAELKLESQSNEPVFGKEGGHSPSQKIDETSLANRWMDAQFFAQQPLKQELSGLVLEYRILQIYSRDSGKREASLGFNVGQGTQDLGFRSEVPILFTCEPSKQLHLHILDENEKPTIASLIVRDALGRVYPAQNKRLAPDFFFHAQIYRADGETVSLAPGTYTVEFGRGPEYLIQTERVSIAPDQPDPKMELHLKRWIHPAKQGWFSGDHHVHAAGCAHYTDPQAGVTPKDMMRHILGEDLNVGCVLSWGPCWYFQKKFFDGKVSPLSKPNYLMRYDVEVSGFPSDYCGHLCLLGLAEDDYKYPKLVEFKYGFEGEKGNFKGTDTEKVAQWPTWDLPILQWGKAQGAVVGFSHSGWGLDTRDPNVPSFKIPPFDGIGANEYIADVTHDAVDFISSVDTPWPYEMNIWYHTNNAGFRVKLSGETDFPCIYGERVGLGRIYTKIDGDLTFDKFLAALKAGRSYVSEGHAHLFDFRVEDRAVGEEGSELKVKAPGTLKAHVRAAALLAERSNPEIAKRKLKDKPYWDIERARIEGTRKVPVELVVNGWPVAKKEIEADGKPQNLEFDVPIERSSWVAVRIFASAHTNPVYVLVDDKPIRASRKSIQWCIDSVDKCWESKSTAKGRLRESERDTCKAAYDHAREVYQKRLSESDVD